MTQYRVPVQVICDGYVNVEADNEVLAESVATNEMNWYYNTQVYLASRNHDIIDWDFDGISCIEIRGNESVEEIDMDELEELRNNSRQTDAICQLEILADSLRKAGIFEVDSEDILEWRLKHLDIVDTVRKVGVGFFDVDCDNITVSIFINEDGQVRLGKTIEYLSEGEEEPYIYDGIWVDEQKGD